VVWVTSQFHKRRIDLWSSQHSIPVLAVLEVCDAMHYALKSLINHREARRPVAVVPRFSRDPLRVIADVGSTNPHRDKGLKTKQL